MVLANDFQKLKNHPAFTGSSIVAEIMLPLLKQHGITFFYFYREYADGSIINLATDDSWTQHSYHKGYINKREKIPAEYLTNPINYFIWLPQVWPEFVIDANVNFDIANVIAIVERQDNYIDYFGYGASRNNISIYNYYLSHLDLLQNYNRYFLLKADHLISKFEKNRIILVDENIPPSKLHTRENKLSNRQQQCAFLLLQGKPSKEIASVLNLSTRTVEYYTEIMKEKLSCGNKYELIMKLQELTFDTLL